MSKKVFDQIAEGLNEALAAVSTTPLPEDSRMTRVKPLGWKAVNEGFGHGRVYYGTGIFGHWYGINRAKANAWYCVHHVGGKTVHLPVLSTVEAAKAAAQADYEARILSALLPDTRDELIRALVSALEPLKAGIDASSNHNIHGELMKRVLVAQSATARIEAALSLSRAQGYGHE